MSDLLPTIAAYVPPSIVRATLAEPSPTLPSIAKAERYGAAVLFADISGFTPLTEALAQKGAEGPEELTRLLNSYFSRMIALIEAEGGEVVKFSGDAVTAVFPATQEALSHATRRAKQAAQVMQAAMIEFATLQTSVGSVALGMKIGIGAGEILAAQVGGIFNRWEYVIAGDPLRQVAEAEHQARRGEIVLSPEAEAIIFPHPLPPQPLLQPDWAQLRQPAAVEAALRPYIPGAITAWLAEGLQKWLAVLRPMSVLFIGVGGLDYTQPNTIEQLHAFLRSAQEIIYHYQGSINKLAVDDKGTILIALFGAPPYAHEDDPERAVRCAMDLQKMAEGQNLHLATGVTTGRVFAGPVGSQTRREYTVMGDTVNLAARLMAVAGPGQVRCDYETYYSTRTRLAFDILPPTRIKGKAGLIRIYRPTGETDPRGETKNQSSLVGRQAELVKIRACLDEVQAGRSRILLIEGEAGIGKSRLLEELMRLARERGLTGLLGMGRSIEQQTPYRAWRDIFNSYFDLDEIITPAERRRRVQSQVSEVTPALAERAPLLNDLLHLGLSENELTASLDTKVRHESLVSLLLALLRAWTVERPLVLILEDAHWLDSLSWDLTLQVARALMVAHAPLLLVLAMRPLEGTAMRVEPLALSSMDETERLPLISLTPEETLALVTARLGITQGRLPKPVADLVSDRAGGNPFFAEELVYTLRDNGLITIVTEQGQTRCLISGDLGQAARTLPDTIQGIVLSRIDRLPPEEQLALKMAAVIGRTFAYSTLYETLGQHMEVGERMLKVYLDDLRHLDLTPLETPEPELTYIFKHIITREVAYATLLFAQRRQLNRTVAQWYECKFGGDTVAPSSNVRLNSSQESPLAPYYPLLVYHWREAEDKERERHYAWLAGQRAAAQFANVEAVTYFNRALELTPPEELAARYELLLAREAVNDLRGERQTQAQDLAALVELVEDLDDDRRRVEIALRQANYAEVTSDYQAALSAVQRGVAQAAQIQDVVGQTEGQITWGKILWRQGDYEAARGALEQALSLAQAHHHHHSEAKNLYYLGHVYLYQNNYPAAQSHYQQALAIYQAIGHRQGEADSLSNLGVIQYELGDYPAARDYYEQVLAIFHTTGDRPGETVVLGNLGNLYCDLGDYATAREYQEKALELRRAVGDRWGEALSLINLGLVYHGLGHDEAARAVCEQALAIQREIGDRRNEGYTLTYLGHALAGLGEWEAAAAAYAEALNLRRELGQPSLAIDDLAGLAYVALNQGQIERALSQVEEILAWLETNGRAGIEYPLQVYLTCYQVLRITANGNARLGELAQTVLTEAHTALQERVGNINDNTLRRSFLENVPANREIITAWAAKETTV